MNGYLSHACFTTSDLGATRHFYEGILKFKVVHESLGELTKAQIKVAKIVWNRYLRFCGDDKGVGDAQRCKNIFCLAACLAVQNLSGATFIGTFVLDLIMCSVGLSTTSCTRVNSRTCVMIRNLSICHGSVRLLRASLH